MTTNKAGQRMLDTERVAHRKYLARWSELRDRGEGLVVIDRVEHRQQWAAWKAYFRAQGLAMLADMMDDTHQRTVPTDWPADFDLIGTPVMERRHAD